MYEGPSEMIWTRLICSNFNIFRLNSKHLLDQHIPLQGLNIAAITLRASRWIHGTILRVLYHSWTVTWSAS
jgi:hypothetical protein